METISLLCQFLALSGAFVGVAAAYRLRKTVGDPYLSEYQTFLILSGVWGCLLWTVPSLFLGVLLKDPAGLFAYNRAVLVLLWFGFPFFLLQLYFLVLTVETLLGRTVRRAFKRAYWSVAPLLFAVFVLVKNRIRRDEGIAEISIWFSLIIVFFMAIQTILMNWAFWRSRGVRDARRRRTARGFSGAYLLSFSLYCLAAVAGLFPPHILALVFSACHVPALVFLFRDARKRGRLENGEEDDLDLFYARFELSPRERDIVRLLLEGTSNREMARRLFLSPQTVKNYVSRVYRRLAVQNRLELINLFHRKDRDQVRPETDS